MIIEPIYNSFLLIGGWLTSGDSYGNLFFVTKNARSKTLVKLISNSLGDTTATVNVSVLSDNTIQITASNVSNLGKGLSYITFN